MEMIVIIIVILIEDAHMLEAIIGKLYKWKQNNVEEEVKEMTDFINRIITHQVLASKRMSALINMKINRETVNTHIASKN